MVTSQVFRPHLALALLLGSSGFSLAYSQSNDKLPPAQAILDRSVFVTGGQAAYDRIENLVMRSTISVAGQAVAQVTSYCTRTGAYRETGSVSGAQTDAGVNEGIAWLRTADAAHLLDTGEEQASALRSAVLLPEGQWRRYYTAVETVGVEPVEGQPCYVLKAVPFAGGSQKLYYDQQTGLLLRRVRPGPNGSELDEAFGEYFDAGGIRMPKVQTMQTRGLAIRIDDIKFNQLIPDSTFQPPSEIVRLVKKRSAAP